MAGREPEAIRRIVQQNIEQLMDMLERNLQRYMSRREVEQLLENHPFEIRIEITRITIEEDGSDLYHVICSLEMTVPMQRVNRDHLQPDSSAAPRDNIEAMVPASRSPDLQPDLNIATHPRAPNQQDQIPPQPAVNRPRDNPSPRSRNVLNQSVQLAGRTDQQTEQHGFRSSEAQPQRRGRVRRMNRRRMNIQTEREGLQDLQSQVDGPQHNAILANTEAQQEQVQTRNQSRASGGDKRETRRRRRT